MVFAYLIIYGSALPQSWRDEEVVTIMFYWGDFSILALAESIIPMSRCIPFIMPVSEGGQFRSYSWSGHVTWLVFNLCIRSTLISRKLISDYLITEHI